MVCCRHCSTSTALSAMQLHCCCTEADGVRILVSSAISEALKKHRGVLMPSTWCDLSPALTGFAMGKGMLFALNKSCPCSVFLLCLTERCPAVAEMQWTLSLRENSAVTWDSSFCCSSNFYSMFAANMVKLALFWKQAVNASEVHTWHMFLFTCCPPFVACSRCSVYHFECILIY